MQFVCDVWCFMGCQFGYILQDSDIIIVDIVMEVDYEIIGVGDMEMRVDDVEEWDVGDRMLRLRVGKEVFFVLDNN